MKLQQLRFLRAVIDNDCNVSRAAEVLHTSQPGISRQLGLLEAELGVEIFVRSSNRLLTLTPVGEQVLALARRALNSIEAIGTVGREFNSPDRGSICVATTHTHARYTLPSVLETFSREFPAVTVNILQGSPDQIVPWVKAGESDIGLSTLPDQPASPLAVLPASVVEHVAIAPLRHPMLRLKKVSFRALANYPFVGYSDAYALSKHILANFRAAGVEPRFVMRANDSDLIKTYVAMGKGVAIVPSIAVEAKIDKHIRARSLVGILPPTQAFVLMRTGVPPRTFILRLLRLLSPELTAERVIGAIGLQMRL